MFLLARNRCQNRQFSQSVTLFKRKKPKPIRGPVETPELDLLSISSAIPQVKLPQGLFIVATPIGNLSDLTFRALQVLKSVDHICCEDTRVTSKLLSRYGIEASLISYHQHTTEAKSNHLLDKIQQGQSLALVTDAGTPVISDPGQSIVSELHERELPVFCVPGPSSVTGSLSVCGFGGTKFVFEGFLPRKQTLKHLQSLFPISETHTIVCRILSTLDDCILVWGENHRGAVIRELTKLHEQVSVGTLKDLRSETEENLLGEFTVIISARASPEMM